MTKQKNEIEEGDVATKIERKIKQPTLFKVILHNDDFTTQEFVVHILQSVFNHSEQEAITIMLHVHTKGRGVAGIFSYEVAEAKAQYVTKVARMNEFPLMCTVEQE